MQQQSSLNPPLNKASRCRPLLGTFVEIEATYIEDPIVGISKAFNIISEVHHSLNFYDQESFLARLNRERKLNFKTLSFDLIPLLCFIKKLFLKTEGKFSPFVNNENKRIGFTTFPLNFDDATIELTEKKAFLELGGVGKGFAVDLAIESLIKSGAKSAVVNAGGDLMTFGKSEIVHIRDTNLNFVVLNEALATSSNDNKWESPGEFWIQDPTKALSPTGIFCIKAPSCMVADALTKAVVLGKRDILKYFNAELLHASI